MKYKALIYYFIFINYLTSDSSTNSTGVFHLQNPNPYWHFSGQDSAKIFRSYCSKEVRMACLIVSHEFTRGAAHTAVIPSGLHGLCESPSSLCGLSGNELWFIGKLWGEGLCHLPRSNVKPFSPLAVLPQETERRYLLPPRRPRVSHHCLLLI